MMKRALEIKLRQRGMLIQGGLYFAAILLLGACSLDIGFPSAKQDTAIPTIYTPAASFTPSEPTETHVSLNLTTLTPTAVPEISSTPEPIPPTPDLSNYPDPQKSFTAWRPPVYPVPWVPSPQDHFYFSNPIAA
jgi:hypothetical protein